MFVNGQQVFYKDSIYVTIKKCENKPFIQEETIWLLMESLVASLASELKHKLLNGRISKIAQPEAVKLLLTVKSTEGQYRLSISADASLPLVYLTSKNKPSPMTAPNFCMLLRKHISGGRIVDIWQPGLERIIHFTIEHLDELGDLCRKDLIVEIMGKSQQYHFL